MTVGDTVIARTARPQPPYEIARTARLAATGNGAKTMNENHRKHRIAVYRAAIDAEEKGIRTEVHTSSERPKNHDDLVLHEPGQPPKAIKIEADG